MTREEIVAKYLAGADVMYPDYEVFTDEHLARFEGEPPNSWRRRQAIRKLIEMHERDAEIFRLLFDLGVSKREAQDTFKMFTSGV